MTYAEFKKTYSWMVKHYPGTDNIYSNWDKTLGKITTTHYRRSGSRWVETDSKTEAFTGEYYANGIDAAPFFRSLGGSERITCGYTRLAYLPTEVSSISPDRQKKTVRHFAFD